MLKQQIKSDLDQALKNQQKEKLAVLRNLWAEIKNEEIEVKRELNNQEILAIINKQVKKSKEAIDLFAKGNRQDLVVQNQAEIVVLQAYLPAQMSQEELLHKVKEIIKQHPEISNQGQLIGLCVRELKNQADSSEIAQMVKSLS